MNTMTLPYGTIEICVGDASVRLDIPAFEKSLELRLQVLDQDKIKTDAKGRPIYSLTQCALVAGVDGPQLNYYVKTGVVKPHGKAMRGKKKYFSYVGLLTFFIIVELKSAMRINVDVVSDLQKQLRRMM
jgi:hypothetical protein